MSSQIVLDDISVDVLFKDIKNIHLGVHPPDGRVRVSAPKHMSLDTLRVFVISKLAWIRQQQRDLRAQPRETPREYLNRESHYVWGRRYLLEVIEVDAPPTVELKGRKMVLRVRPGTNDVKRGELVARWYRNQIKAALSGLFAKWAPVMGVSVERCFIQQMKTKWGSCNPTKRHIRLNTELAKKPRECLEYIVVHEMTHLLEPTHNAHFIALMDRFMPSWRHLRDELNRLPVRHEEWEY